MGALVWTGLSKTLAAIVLSPLVGFLLALVLVAIVSWLSVRSTPFVVDRAFRMLQFVSASLYSLGHGGNDAQKTMGIIAVLLFSQGYLGNEFYVPFWVVITCQLMMGLGTLMGGWRIVKTMGSRITRLTPMQGFCAETGGAATLFAATALGVPVSTTHTITGAIVGVGSRPPGVRRALEHRQLHRRRLGDHHPGVGVHCGTDLRDRVGAEVSRPQVTAFNPAIPAMIRPMQPRRIAVAGSLNRKMPRIATPTVPMPVQTA